MAVHGVCNGGWWVRNAIFHHLPATRPARAFEGAGFKRHFCRALLAVGIDGASERTIYNAITMLRRYLPDALRLRNVRGAGYVLDGRKVTAHVTK